MLVFASACLLSTRNIPCGSWIYDNICFLSCPVQFLTACFFMFSLNSLHLGSGEATSWCTCKPCLRGSIAWGPLPISAMLSGDGRGDPLAAVEWFAKLSQQLVNRMVIPSNEQKSYSAHVHSFWVQGEFQGCVHMVDGACSPGSFAKNSSLKSWHSWSIKLPSKSLAAEICLCSMPCHLVVSRSRHPTPTWRFWDFPEYLPDKSTHGTNANPTTSWDLL